MSPTRHAWQLADRDRQGLAREVETLRKPALRVLIVEESEEDARLLLGELRRAYRPAYKRVETEPALISALEKQTWDIVLSDFSLPCFNGMAALKAVRAAGLDLPFLMISEAIGEELAVEVLRAGAQDFILKNRLSRLLPAIEREMHEARLRQERRQAQEQIRRTLTDIRADWKQVFETLAGQAGIAIDNALLLGALQRSNAELIMAYDLTLEGWIRALDLR
ncbi:MAG TPA: response regulator, partial [Chthonomonadaceae bacterium]|nr:response regulator [Chthonomonadaceae bacterium]